MANNLWDMLTMAPQERMQQAGWAREAETANTVGQWLGENKVAPDPNAQFPGPYGTGQPEMESYRQQLAGGFRQPSGLIGAMPSSAQFIDLAARAPALTQPLLTTAQQQQAAMDRQVQEQTWRQSNMTASEFANHQLNTQKFEYDTGRPDYTLMNPAAVRDAQVKAQQANTAQGWASYGLQARQDAREQGKFEAQFPMGPAGVRVPYESTAPKPLSFDNQTEVRTAYGNAQNAMNVLADYERLIAGGEAPGFFTAGTARGQQFQQNFEAALVPIVTKMFKPSGDAPSESELKQIKAYIGDLTSMGTDAGKLQKLRQLQEDVKRYWNPYLQYGAVPTPQEGGSAFARSYPGTVIPRPEGLKPFTPGGK